MVMIIYNTDRDAYTAVIAWSLYKTTYVTWPTCSICCQKIYYFKSTAFRKGHRLVAACDILVSIIYVWNTIIKLPVVIKEIFYW